MSEKYIDSVMHGATIKVINMYMCLINLYSVLKSFCTVVFGL